MKRSPGTLVAIAVMPVLALMGIPMLAAATETDSTGLLPPPPMTRPTAPVLFEDHFASLNAWQPDREGVWTVLDSAVCGRLPGEKQKRSFLYAGSEDWHGYAVDLDLLQLRGVDKGVVVCVRGNRGIGVDLRGGSYQDVLVYRNSAALGRAPAPNQDRVWHHLRIEVRGRTYAISVDGGHVLDCADPMGAARGGRIALVAYTGGEGECSVQYANVVVTRLD
jgi:hypothetical protein